MELVNFILSIAGVLIVILLGIIGFFLRRQITVIECLTESVNELKINQQLISNNESNFNMNCINRHVIIDKRLANFDDLILNHHFPPKLKTARQKPIKKTQS